MATRRVTQLLAEVDQDASDVDRRVTQLSLSVEQDPEVDRRITQASLSVEQDPYVNRETSFLFVEVEYTEGELPPPDGAHGVIDVTRLCKISGPTRYQIVIVDHDGTNLTLINEFERLEYIKTLNGRGHHGWGTYHLHGAASTIPTEYFTLDRLISVRRLPQGAEDWVIDFEGLNRTYGSYYSEDDDIERFLSSFSPPQGTPSSR